MGVCENGSHKPVRSSKKKGQTKLAVRGYSRVPDLYDHIDQGQGLAYKGSERIHFLPAHAEIGNEKGYF